MKKTQGKGLARWGCAALMASLSCVAFADDASGFSLGVGGGYTQMRGTGFGLNVSAGYRFSSYAAVEVGGLAAMASNKASTDNGSTTTEVTGWTAGLTLASPAFSQEKVRFFGKLGYSRLTPDVTISSKPNSSNNSTVTGKEGGDGKDAIFWGLGFEIPLSKSSWGLEYTSYDVGNPGGMGRLEWFGIRSRFYF